MINMYSEHDYQNMYPMQTLQYKHTLTFLGQSSTGIYREAPRRASGGIQEINLLKQWMLLHTLLSFNAI